MIGIVFFSVLSKEDQNLIINSVINFAKPLFHYQIICKLRIFHCLIQPGNNAWTV